MTSGWWYRVAGVVGAGALSLAAVAVANQPAVQRVAVAALVVGRLGVVSLAGAEFALVAATVLAVTLVTLGPLYKPRPRRVLDTITLAQRRVLLSVFVLATVGYFDYTLRVPRTTLVVTAALLFGALPAWFVAIRRRSTDANDRTVLVGDAPRNIDPVLREIDRPVVGYVAPETATATEPEQAVYADGGTIASDRLAELDCLGGLSRLDQVLRTYDVGDVVLAFSGPEHEEFFGALETCHEHGVPAKVHREHADTVLTEGADPLAELVEVDIEPWDWQDRTLKRGFDVAFAAAALLVAAPLMAVIAAAVWLDSDGPVFYSQERTAEFGGRLTVRKFRTMVPGDESDDPDDESDDDRITRVGRVLRKTHLDEIPQLWTILVGDMSVVGPRAAWTEEEAFLEDRATGWRKRWFVKPGLTGLAQVEGVSSTEPGEKLRLDVRYIRNQSFRFDLLIVGRQLWTVAEDAWHIATGGD